MSFKHPWVYIYHNNPLLRFFRNIKQNPISEHYLTLTEKGMNQRYVLMVQKCHLWCSLRFTNPFETLGIVPAAHNYENVDFSKNRPTCTLFFEKGMSPDIISSPSNCSPVFVLWYRHVKLITAGPYKNLWAKIFYKNVKISKIFGQKFL